MRRNLIIAVFALLAAAVGAAVFLLVRGSGSASMSVQADEENADNPYVAEMNCIDRLLQRNDMEANQVGPAMANCRNPRGGTNQASGP